MSSILYVRPPLAAYQTEAIFHECRYGEIEASTKSGKTHGCIAWLVEQALLKGGPGRNFWWVAPTYAQAKIAYTRTKLAIPEALRRCNDSDLTITIINGAVMWYKSGEKPDNLYGEDVYAAVIDEASRLREEAWWAVRSTLTATNGPVRLIGNVKGRRNWFYKLCRKAEAGEVGHLYRKITAQDAVDAKILTAAEIADARVVLPEAVYRELFEAVPNDDVSNPFGMKYIAAAIAPMSLAPIAAAGLDLAKSVDWTVHTGLDITGGVVMFDRFQLDWDNTYKRVVANPRTFFTLADSTGVGDPIVEKFEREFPGFFSGYKFTQESKQKLMEGLSVGVQTGGVKILEGVMRQEMESFEYEYTRTGVRYSAPEGMNDDCVVSLALAYRALTFPEYAAVTTGGIRTAPVSDMIRTGGSDYIQGADLS